MRLGTGILGAIALLLFLGLAKNGLVVLANHLGLGVVVLALGSYYCAVLGVVERDNGGGLLRALVGRLAAVVVQTLAAGRVGGVAHEGALALELVAVVHGLAAGNPTMGADGAVLIDHLVAELVFCGVAAHPRPFRVFMRIAAALGWAVPNVDST